MMSTKYDGLKRKGRETEPDEKKRTYGGWVERQEDLTIAAITQPEVARDAIKGQIV